MFNTISWQSYLTTLALVIAIYYAFLLIFYYRNDLEVLVRSKNESQPFQANGEEFQRPSVDSDEGIVYACMDEVNAFFEEAKKRKWHKNELTYAIQSIVKKYPAIRTSGYKKSVSTVLQNQCEHICNIHISAEELEHVWLGS